MVEENPKLKEEIGGSIPGCEISFLLDKNLVKWLTTSCALALACPPSVSKKQKTRYSNAWKHVLFEFGMHLL